MEVNQQVGDLHESVIALETFFHFLRLFMMLLDKYPELYYTIDRRVEEFMKSDDVRHKKNFPNLGCFAILLALSKKYSLRDPDILKTYIREGSARSIRWITQSIN